MKKILSTVSLFGLVAFPALAFEPSDVVRCKAIAADAPRLACFDAVTADIGGQEPAVEAEKPPEAQNQDTGVWQVNLEVDPITDEKILTAAVESDLSSSSYRKPALIVRCKSKLPEIFIAWNDYLGDESVVTVRIDDNEPKSSSWSQSTDQSATFAFQPADFLASILDASRVSARITPYHSGPVTANFPISGLKGVMATNGDLCGLEPK